MNLLCRIENSQLYIQVNDKGLCIPADDIKHIFDKYYQSQTTAQHLGTGIGLSLVKELCHFLGGTIKVESELGGGSTFVLTIPTRFDFSDKVIKDVVIEQSGHAKPTSIVIDGMRPNVLIVEDDLDMIKYIDSIFKHHFDTYLAYNGRQALDMLSRHKFELIIPDMMMPEIDGFRLKEEIRKNGALDMIPFIMLTAHALDEDKLKGLRLGVDDYITKPFNVDEFVTKAHDLLANKLERKATNLNKPVESSDEKLVEQL